MNLALMIYGEVCTIADFRTLILSGLKFNCLILRSNLRLCSFEGYFSFYRNYCVETFCHDVKQCGYLFNLRKFRKSKILKLMTNLEFF